jgi:hypothetical protein
VKIEVYTYSRHIRITSGQNLSSYLRRGGLSVVCSDDLKVWLDLACDGWMGKMMVGRCVVSF